MAFIDLPLEVRLVVLFLLGTCVGAVANWATYSLCYFPRLASPWSRGYPKQGTALWLDRVPLVGWLRERPRGDSFAEVGWVRPLFVELLTGVAFTGLYAWEIVELKLVFPGANGLFVEPPRQLLENLHWQYLSHILLISFMIPISLIDLDEQTIPDSLTVPGTLLGLALAMLVPYSLLPADTFWFPGVQSPLHITSPNNWPVQLNSTTGLCIGLACYIGWCAALLPRTWYPRHGRRRAIQLCLARMTRALLSARFWLLLSFGSTTVFAIWHWGGPSRLSWEALLTSLVGLAAGGGLVWAVRIIGSTALGKEAMGFGDVILMAMIGAFLGWQPVLITFFLAPFAGLILGLAKLILRGEQALPYGPFLCLGAVVTIIHWVAIWEWARPMFAFGLLVPGAVAVCLLLTGVLLLVLRGVRTVIERRSD